MNNTRLSIQLIFLFFFLVGSWAQSLAQQPPSAQKLVEHADQYRGYVAGFTATLEVTSIVPDKADRSNRLSLFVKGLNSLVKYEAPARDKGKAMLFKERELWFHVPKTKRLIRLTPIQRLLGQASNGDVAGTRFSDDYRAQLVGQEIVHNVACHVLELKAVSRKVTYARLKYWVAQDDHRPIQSEHYSLSGKLLKVAHYAEFTAVNDDQVPKLAKLIIRDPLKSGEQTTIAYKNWKQAELSEAMFQKTYLKRLK